MPFSAMAPTLLHLGVGSINTGGRKPEVVMANETELFFLVLIVVLTLIMHYILAWKGPRPDDKT